MRKPTDPVSPAVRPPLSFAAFKTANRKRCEDPQGFNHKLSSWSTSDWFVAIVGELGEAANLVKKLNRYRDGVRGNKESEAALRVKLRGELADTFIYLDLICQACGIDLGEAVIDTFDAKSAEIDYPERLRAVAEGGSPSPEVERAFKEGWRTGYYDGGEHDCRMFSPTAERAWQDYEAARAARRARNDLLGWR